MANPVIALDDVFLTLASRAGPVEILRGIELSVGAGQSLAVVGPSGCGKTSLLMVIAGLERATRGSVRIVGHDFMAIGQDALARVRGSAIGIVFQSFHLVATMTALENVALPLEFAGRRDAFAVAKALLAEVGLEKRAEHFPAELSGGEQQRVAIARAVANAPRVLLADEPTGNLDATTADTVFRQLLTLVRETGMAALIATHNPDLAARMDRTVHLKDGILS